MQWSKIQGGKSVDTRLMSHQTLFERGLGACYPCGGQQIFIYVQLQEHAMNYFWYAAFRTQSNFTLPLKEHKVFYNLQRINVERQCCRDGYEIAPDSGFWTGL